jgi:hypothetical protein
MTKQIIYTPENPPTKGIAKKIWGVFINKKLDPQELHYNIGRQSINGSGTWACTLNNGPVVLDRDATHGTIDGEYWCGIIGKTAVYIEGMVAPYSRVLVGFTTNVCPFRYGKHACRYPSMCKNLDNIWPDGCPTDKEFRCNTGTEEFLIQRNNEYARWKKN